MKIRNIDLDTDFKVLCNWLTDHNKPLISKDLYPPTGFMIQDEKMDLVAGFLYKTDSKLCVVENFISNPIIAKDQRREAITLLFKTIIQKAQNDGFKIMFTSAILDSLIKQLNDLDFKELKTDRLFFRSL